MTIREFYTAVIEAAVSEELTEKATEMLGKLDAANVARVAKNAEKRAEKDAEKAPIRAAILNALTAEPMTATALIEAAGIEVKPQSIPSLVKPLVEAGQVVKTDIKVTGKGTVRGYARA